MDGKEMFAQGKRYYTINQYYRARFGQKVAKVPIDGGFTCPNRDGLVGWGGCTFCSGRGSGDFAGSRYAPICQQFIQSAKLLERKWKDVAYIAYFQAFTGTYASMADLESAYMQALAQDNVVGLAIATRPDCLGEEVVHLLKRIARKTALFVELGLQTANENTAARINRCYDTNLFEQAVKSLNQYNIDTCAHLILGLPGETRQDMLESVGYAAACGINGIKLQLLHILSDAPIAKEYLKGNISVMSFDEYVATVCDCIEVLPAHIAVHRLTGDGMHQKLLAPDWSRDKRKVLNAIDKQLAIRNTYQGIYA